MTDKIKVIIKKKEIPVHDPYYISIDVAIKTLAYCLLDKDGFPIQWEVINLADGDTKLTCNAFTKAGLKCSKKAQYAFNGKGLCLVHYKTSDTNYQRNITIDNTTDYELITSLYERLGKISGLSDIKCALIEKQPNKATEKIKHVAYSIFSYFVMLKIPYVTFVDAKNKLTLYDGPPISCHLKDQYGRNKWYAKKYCEYILTQRQYTDALKTYNNFKKKDDPADCYLQGLWYIKYGQYGTRAPTMSPHQTLINKENNIIKYNKARPYKPKEKSTRYTLSNIKYLIMKNSEYSPNLESSIKYYFDSLEYFEKNCKK